MNRARTFLGILGLWFFGVAPSGLIAQALVVQTGEHSSFTRVVLTGSMNPGWTFGRTDDGYALDLGQNPPPVDLTAAFTRIRRDRIAALWVDPATKALRLRIVCICNAVPYELEPGVMVIDVRDGPPAPGSSFELPIAGASVPQLGPPLPLRPRTRPDQGQTDLVYNWKTFPANRVFPATTFPAIPLQTPAQRMDTAALRDGLLRQLSDGAARGVVTFALPPTAESLALGPDPAASRNPPYLADHLRTGQDLGVIIIPGGKEDTRGTAQPLGSVCLTDEDLDLANWGIGSEGTNPFPPIYDGLVAEFDEPDGARLESAIKHLLSIGFGAEAVQLLAAFPGILADESQLRAMGRIVDDLPDTDATFAQMAGCDTAASLWAALAVLRSDLPPDLNTGAVVRAFSALPPPLRMSLGPRLSDAMLRSGDFESARKIVAAAQRAPVNPAPALDLADARVNAAMGADAQALAGFAEVAQGNGPDAAQALIEVVNAHVTDASPLDPAQVDTLRALVQEYRGSTMERPLQRALALAHATRDEFGVAFVEARTFAAEIPEIWTLLAYNGPDAAVLEHAILPDDAADPLLAADVRRKLASRLIVLGLPDPALRWVAGTAAPLAQEDILIVAQAQIDRRDGLAALQTLGSLSDEGANGLRSKAHLILDQTQQALVMDPAQVDVAQRITLIMAGQDLSLLPTDADPIWAEAVASAIPMQDARPEPAPERATASDPPPGPLARSRALLEESRATQATLAQLLAEVPTPAADSPDPVFP